MGLADTFKVSDYQAATTSSVTPSSSGGFSAGSALGLIGNFLQVGSQIYGGVLQNRLAGANARLTEAQGNYSSAVSEFNAAVARANAEAIRSVADLDIGRQKKAAKRFTSSQVAQYAKSGVKLEGSPLSVMVDSAAEAELDMAITDYNAKIGIMQAQSQAKGYDKERDATKALSESTAKIQRAAGKYAQSQSMIKGTSNLLSTSLEFLKR